VNHSEHKRLMTQHRTVQKRIGVIQCDILNQEDTIKRLTVELREIESKIAQAGKLRLVVTEHAILRYMERVQGVDVKSISETIQSDLEMVGAGLDGVYSLGQYKATVRDGVVVTVTA